MFYFYKRFSLFLFYFILYYGRRGYMGPYTNYYKPAQTTFRGPGGRPPGGPGGRPPGRPPRPPMNNNRLVGGGFLGPFLLGGLTGGLVAPFFYGGNNRPNYYYPAPYYPPYYRPY